jgi:hypothetical protein
MMLARQFAVAIGIALLLPLLVYQGVNLIQPYPHIESYVEGWVDAGPGTPEDAKVREEEKRAREQRDREERDAVDKATLPFSRLLILVATPLGVAAMLVGSYLRIASIGTGLIFGGMLTVFDGYSDYWDHLDNWLRFVSLLAGLCLVIFLGYRQFRTANNRPT